MDLQQMIDEKNTFFVYLVDFVRLQILQFLQGHRKKIINFVNFIAELTILDISVGKFCLRHLI